MFIGAGLLIKQRCTKPIYEQDGTIFLYGYCKQAHYCHQAGSRHFLGWVKSGSNKNSWYLAPS